MIPNRTVSLGATFACFGSGSGLRKIVRAPSDPPAAAALTSRNSRRENLLLDIPISMASVAISGVLRVAAGGEYRKPYSFPIGSSCGNRCRCHQTPGDKEMKRREFVKALGLAAVGSQLGCASSGAGSAVGSRRLSKVGIQLYTLRDD